MLGINYALCFFDKLRANIMGSVKMYKNLLAFALLLFSFGQVLAIPITVNFAAYDFLNGPPTDPVVGTIVYEASDEYAVIDSLTSISMMIDGHNYTLPEIDFVSPWGGAWQMVHGALNGGAVQTGTSDFILLWNMVTLIPDSFYYVTSSTNYTHSTFKSLGVLFPAPWGV